MECQRNAKKYTIQKTQQRELPHDLIAEMVLTKLPIKSIVRFKSVSKLWYSTLSSSRFAFAHFKSPHPLPIQTLLIQSENKFQLLSYENGELDLVNMKVDFDVHKDRMLLVGTCNGLVCLGSKTSLSFILWNPITRKFRKYSNYKACKDNKWFVTWGFGYVSATNDYKIIGICQGFRVFSVHVFSIRLNRWRRIDDDFSAQNFSDLRISDYLARPGLLVNETLYWMTVGRKAGVRRNILFFDLALELFDTFPHLTVSTPTTWVGDKCYDKFLCVVKGCLSKFGIIFRTLELVITMMKNPGETEHIVLSGDLRSICWVSGIFSTGVRGSDKYFTKYSAISERKIRIGVMDISLSPIEHTSLATFDETSEIASYSASLLSPGPLLLRGTANL